MQIALGSLIVLEGSTVLVQSRVNAAWEAAFYGSASPLALAITVWAGIIVGLGLCTVGIGLGYVRGALSGQWVLLTSLLLMCVVPEVIAWVLLAGSFLVIVDRWTTLRQPPA